MKMFFSYELGYVYTMYVYCLVKVGCGGANLYMAVVCFPLLDSHLFMADS